MGFIHDEARAGSGLVLESALVRHLLPILASVLLSACAPQATAPQGTHAPAAPVTGPPLAAGHKGGPGAFIEDNVPAAFAAAKSHGKLVFVDAWAPWCHSCLSMKAVVFEDPSLAEFQKDVVFASVNTEHDTNEDFVRAHPSRVWPTLYVFEPDNGALLGVVMGSLTAGELSEFLRDMLVVRRQPERGKDLTALREAHEQALAEKWPEAATQFRALLPSSAPSVALRAANGLAYVLAQQHEYAECMRVVSAVPAASLRGSTGADLLATGLGCAMEHKTSAPELLERVRAFIGSKDLAADDVSGLLEAQFEYLTAMQGTVEARALALSWAKYLEGEAAKAKSTEGRAVFDSHRVLAYTAMGQPELALPMLAASAKDFPADYNPHARAALVYKTLGRLPEARASIALAQARVYGPRSLRVAELCADIAKAMGDAPAERACVDAGLSKTAKVPLTARQSAQRRKLEQRGAGVVRP